jgi:hypothetical protein
VLGLAGLRFLGIASSTKVQLWLWKLHITQEGESALMTQRLFRLLQASHGRSGRVDAGESVILEAVGDDIVTLCWTESGAM